MTDREYRNEGDKQFEKLNTEIKKLQEENRDVQQTCENYYNEMRAYKNQVADLEKQIEKMKCCENCKYKDCNKTSQYQTCWYCKNKNKWKLAE